MRRGQAQGEELGGDEDLFVGTPVEGEPVPVPADEHGAPSTPIILRAKEHRVLSAIFAREDALLLERFLHEFTSFAL